MHETSGSNRGLRIYRRLLQYALKYWGVLVLSIIGSMIFAATDTGFAALMKPMLDGSFVEKDPATIRWVPIALVFIFVFRAFGNFMSTYFMMFVGRLVVKDLRREMFDKLLHMPVAYYDSNTAGQLISKLTFNVELVSRASAQSLLKLTQDSLTVLALLGWMFYLNWILCISFLLVTPLIIVIVANVSKRFRRITHNIQKSMGDVTHIVEEVIRSNRVVKIFGGYEYEKRHFERVNDKNRKLYLRLIATDSLSSSVIQLIAAMALAGIIFLATLEPVLSEITVGTFVSFMTAMIMTIAPSRRLVGINAALQQGIAACESIFELLDSEVERDRSTRQLEKVHGKVEYKEIHFCYDLAKGDVLNDVSITANLGETVALVGRSGSGKSTLVNLLPRFYDVERGAILIDDVNIQEYSLKSLRNYIAYVGQEVTLFNDTVANNIAYGSTNGMDHEQLSEVARLAHATEFIEKLPQGLNTLIGENGVLLSGGQRQRIAIARALLKNAPILILDEATSALDTESEMYIQQALKSLIQNRTTLVIAHRLSTVENADRIYVLDEGHVVETGNHAQLLAQDRIYAMLYRKQFTDGNDNE